MKFSFPKFLSMFSQIRHSFFAVIVLIQVLMISLSVIFARMTIDLLDQTQEDKHRLEIVNIYNKINADIENPKAVISGIANNKEILGAFAQRDRKKLLNVVQPIWQDLQKRGYKQFQFHIPEKTSYVTFLRAHHPENFGDDLSYRPMIAKANVKREMESGLEQGKSGYGFRVIVPLHYEGKHIGSVELGSNFGEDFLKELNVDYPGNWALYNLDRGLRALDDRVLISTLGKDQDGEFKNLLPGEEILAKLKVGETYTVRSKQFNTTNIYIPIKNFQGDIAVILKHVYPSQYFKRINTIITTSAVICLLALSLTALILWVLHRLIATPLRNLVSETEKIRNFQLDDEITYTSSFKELTNLIESTRSMKTGLQSFRKYVPAELVRQLIATDQVAIVGGQRRQITVFFSDVADFTTISESLTPNELTEQLSEYLSVMTDTVLKYKGTVDKYIGDSVMAFWGAPVDVENPAELAALAALECKSKCAELNARWIKEGKKPFHTRIGLNSGEIIVGNMGSSQRLNYTIIGDDVNLASRLEGLNKIYGTQILLSQSTMELLPPDFALRLLDFVLVKGKIKPVTVYELVAKKEDVTAFDLDFLKEYNQAIAQYKARNWDEAIELFEDLKTEHPNDLATLQLIARCQIYKKNPPPEKWKGEFVQS